jgi:acyl carrier protein
MEGAAVRPRTALEEDVLAMWSERLAGRSLGVTDHLFEVGGDSLTAVRLIAAAQRRYGIRIDRRRLFEAFTLAVMAELISEATGGVRR